MFFFIVFDFLEKKYENKTQGHFKCTQGHPKILQGRPRATQVTQGIQGTQGTQGTQGKKQFFLRRKKQNWPD